MSTEDWIVLTNLLVALTSILAAAAAEHDAVKAMRDTVLGIIRTLARPIVNNNSSPEDEDKEE